MIKVECAICGKSMGEKPCEPHNDGKVSSGYCPDCLTAELAFIEAETPESRARAGAIRWMRRSLGVTRKEGLHIRFAEGI